MSSEAKVSGLVAGLSALSAWSLMVFGGLSLLVVCFSWSLGGMLIGGALLGHGYYELRALKDFQRTGQGAVSRRLAWNQMALAGSVSLYLGWRVLSIDRAELEAMLARDPSRSLLAQLPPATVELLQEELPRLLAGAYAIAGFLVILGCLGMALVYLRSGRK